MKRVGLTELKNRLSHYLRLVKSGETIEVLERSVPIARLRGIEPGTSGNSHLERLVRDGVVAKPRRSNAAGTLKKPPVPCRGDVVEALVGERGDR